MRIVIIENNDENLMELIDVVKEIEPKSIIKGFTDGNEAIKWCNDNSFCIDLFIGNWWGINDKNDSPEGANVFDIVKWYKRPKKILVGENSMFEKWTSGEGEAGYISRPVTIEKMNKLLFKET